MSAGVLGSQVSTAFTQARQRAAQPAFNTLQLNGQSVKVQTPFPSPTDWRDCWIYFFLTDRFNNPSAAPAAPWNQIYNFWQGGKFEGVRQQLGYLQSLGVNAIWLSPIVKNPKPASFAYTYPGYDAQDFLSIDGRFATDGTEATAEKELTALVQEAHARGIYVILDIVLNHAGQVFNYIYNGAPTADFTDPNVMNGPLGSEPPIQWMTGTGAVNSAWQNTLPAPAALSPDDAVWPIDLQRTDFFRRRGNRLSDTLVPPSDFIRGDFDTLRQMVHEYNASAPGLEALRAQYGVMPVLNILILIYQYHVAKFDFDGFRIDTVKYMDPDIVETFGNAMREFALEIGKKNFFTFGEIYDDETNIDLFVGRNSGDVDGFGIDAALDYPLFYILPNVIKGFAGVETIQNVFINRKLAEQGNISSHGEAGKYFVSFLDNHDQNQRFNAPGTPPAQVYMGLAVLFSLQGIPCVYYGTEQGLIGTNDGHGNPTLTANESVREALWGKTPIAFDTTNSYYAQLKKIVAVRASQAALRYGRLYFRPVAGDGINFNPSTGPGGIIVFSRILNDREVVVVANTSTTNQFPGWVIVDFDLNQSGRNFSIVYSNMGTTATTPTRVQVPITQAAIQVSLAPMEVQILAPA
jgi:glycosidase